MAELAVIIVNHNHGEMLRKTVESLPFLTFDDPFQVFVINNIPDEHVTTWVKQTFPDFHLIQNENPRGFAANINQVIRNNPHFDYYLLLNPDVICLPGMIETLLEVMEGDPHIGAAAPELLNFDGTVQPSRRRFASFRVLIYRALHIDALIRDIPAVDHYLMNGVTFDPVTEVDWVTGAAMILRKATLDDIGLMDERFFLYFEDEDLCCRMWRNDWKVCYVTEAKAFHAHLAEGRNKILSKANIHHVLSAFKMLIKYRGKISTCHKP